MSVVNKYEHLFRPSAYRVDSVQEREVCLLLPLEFVL